MLRDKNSLTPNSQKNYSKLSLCGPIAQLARATGS